MGSMRITTLKLSFSMGWKVHSGVQVGSGWGYPHDGHDSTDGKTLSSGLRSLVTVVTLYAQRVTWWSFFRLLATIKLSLIELRVSG